ncbi:heparan-alpha-glucosaminide N-acetyltransferase [Ditylenchus destructor]|nr:heparan-alpha-glucosaminide N-acetyltransferase [Ditylenchus destructor]
MSVMPINDQNHTDDRDIEKHRADGSFCDPPLPQEMPKQTSQRFPALDIFRGITLCGMCVGINPIFFDGILAHAEWSGFTLSDLGLPSFVFIMGCSVSFTECRLRTIPVYKAIYTILKRTALLFLFGFIYEWFPFATIDVNSERISPFPIGMTRIMGVLQRMGLGPSLAGVYASMENPGWIPGWIPGWDPGWAGVYASMEKPRMEPSLGPILKSNRFDF